MPDDYSPTPSSQDESNIPASVTFMELMRQAASRAAASKPQTVQSARAAPAVPPDAPGTADPAVLPVADEAEDSQHFDAMEAERVRRVKRRRARRRRQTVGTLGGVLRSFIVVITAAGLMATIFTWFTPNDFIDSDVRSALGMAQATSQPLAVQPTIIPTPNWLRRIGIVSGHRGPQNDPGAVCPDGLTEAEINFNTAQLVVRNLRGRGYSVDLLDEFDPRLDNYQAAALVSIHANTCQEWPNNEVVSGYLIAAAAARITARGNDNVLVECIARYYQAATGLQRRPGVTVDMTDYHTFREIHPLTPAAIIELGFMLADRELLTAGTDVMANAITDGILCFLEPSQVPPTATPIS